MKRFLSIVLALAIVPAAIAQDTGSPQTKDTLEEYYKNPLLQGTQDISINLGTIIPMFISNPADGSISPSQMFMGGTFSFSYEYFLLKSFSVGGTFGGSFNSTITFQSLFMLPLTATVSYYFVLMPIELAPTLELGCAWIKVNDLFTFQPLVKFGLEAYYRTGKDWSLGLDAKYWLVPELYSGSMANQSRIGNFLELSLSAMYHF